MDIFIGFGKTLRIRLLKQGRHRRSLIRNVHIETVSEKQVRHDKAVEILEARRQAWLNGEHDLISYEKQIRALGFEFADEPDADDGRYSYWRVR